MLNCCVGDSFPFFVFASLRACQSDVETLVHLLSMVIITFFLLFFLPSCYSTGGGGSLPPLPPPPPPVGTLLDLHLVVKERTRTERDPTEPGPSARKCVLLCLWNDLRTHSRVGLSSVDNQTFFFFFFFQ